jgi:hypothetical protein
MEGNTQYYLYAYYKPDTTDSFEIAIEIINYLGKYFVNPYYIYEARHEYKKLRINKVQTFYEFKTKFIYLADKA